MHQRYHWNSIQAGFEPSLDPNQQLPVGSRHTVYKPLLQLGKGYWYIRETLYCMNY